MIKSDRWIQEMAETADLITPFESAQIKTLNNKPVISYGLSSYGYDIRCANEFKVFTNLYTTIVDPKNFDEKNFIDFIDTQDDFCIIPPHSFALSRTIEKFKIPRNILAICLGKSTYARCFSADTRVALVDGTSASLEEMAYRSEKGELFWGYSMVNGRIIVSLLDKPRLIGRDALLEIILDNGKVIHATPDHLFMRRDGEMVAADSLRPNDALMPLYRSVHRGYEQVYQPLTGHLLPTHRLADQPINILQDKSEFIRNTYGSSYLNHKIISIRELAGDHDVYCLTVPEAGNFALDAGVFVKNCGLIVNVTPLEPEWEGYLTLELSNTTPLPAKIYANEGIAQIIFLESDEQCKVSYKDRHGKYQHQVGVTLPRLLKDKQ